MICFFHVCGRKDSTTYYGNTELARTCLVHGQHSFVVAGDARFKVPLHIDLALVQHLKNGGPRWLCGGGGVQDIGKGARSRSRFLWGAVGKLRGSALISCIAVVLRLLTLASPPCRDGGRQIFTDQADTACTEREATGIKAYEHAVSTRTYVHHASTYGHTGIVACETCLLHFLEHDLKVLPCLLEVSQHFLLLFRDRNIEL